MALSRRSQRLLKPYLQKLRAKSVRKFSSREEVSDFLYEDVFKFDEFQNNIKEVADLQQVSYIVAYEIITNHLIDIVNEIDKAQASKKNIRILILRYMKLDVRFAIGIENTLFLLKRIINLN